MRRAGCRCRIARGRLIDKDAQKLILSMFPREGPKLDLAKALASDKEASALLRVHRGEPTAAAESPGARRAMAARGRGNSTAGPSREWVATVARGPGWVRATRHDGRGGVSNQRLRRGGEGGRMMWGHPSRSDDGEASRGPGGLDRRDGLRVSWVALKGTGCLSPRQAGR